MNNQLEDLQQPKHYQLDEIWCEVLKCLFTCSNIHRKLFRNYGDLLSFDETGACVRLRLFADSWLMRLKKQHLEKVLTSSFLSAYRLVKSKAEQEERARTSRIKQEEKLKKLMPEIEAQQKKGLTKRGKKLTERGIKMKNRQVEYAKKELQTLNKINKNASVIKQWTLSDNFYIRVEIEEIYNYLPQQLLPFQYPSLDGLLPFPLLSVSLSKRHNLPTCPAIYFVLEGDSDPNSRVLYVGQAVNLARRWQNHNLWKQLNMGNNLRIAWLECNKSEAVLSIIEAAFIQSLDPELNQDRDPIWLSLALPRIGWDYQAVKNAVRILQKMDKTKQEKQIFAAILQELLFAKPQPLPVAENWRPSYKETVLWVFEGKELPCQVREIVEEKSEAEIYLSTGKETIKTAKDKALISGRRGGFYVPLSELRPAQGLGLSIVEAIALDGMKKSEVA